MAREPADRALLSLGDFARVEPPAFLDELVRQRVDALLEQRRAELVGEPAAGAPWPTEPSLASSAAGNPAQRTAPAGLGRAEAWAYAFGFLAYGAQVADGLARLIWRAMSG